MQINVKKRVLVMTAVAAVVLGLTTTAAVGSGVHHAPTAELKPRVTRAHVAAPRPAARRVASSISRSTVRSTAEVSPPAPRTPARTPARTQRPTTGVVIRVTAVTNPNDAQAAADACRGPIEILWPGLPTEIAQHDYCGGAWFDSVTTGERIEVSGGTMPGLFVVNGRRRVVNHGTSASILSGLGDLVLQTCVGSQMILVGLDRA